MASTRQFKEERAEATAKLAAFDLSNVNRERSECEEGVKTTEQTQYSQQQCHQEQDQRPGVIGSVMKVVHDTYEHAKEAVVGKTQETTESTRETTEQAAEKAKEVKDRAAEKAREAKDTTAEKTKYKDYTTEKAKETTEKAAEKARETEDSTKGKVEEYKDYAVEKAKEATEKAQYI